MMEFLLFVSQVFGPCREAERVWRTVAAETGCSLTVVDINSPEGHDLAKRLRVTVVPAVATEGRLLAIGVQNAEEARGLVGTGKR
jgi:thioredoxin-like negative regulator of GroEL